MIVAVQIPQALHPAQAHLPRVRRLRGSVSRGSWERSQSVLPSRPLDFCRPSTGWSLRTAALDSWRISRLSAQDRHPGRGHSSEQYIEGLKLQDSQNFAASNPEALHSQPAPDPEQEGRRARACSGRPYLQRFRLLFARRVALPLTGAFRKGQQLDSNTPWTDMDRCNSRPTGLH